MGNRYRHEHNLCSVGGVEAATVLDFFTALPDGAERSVEASAVSSVWPTSGAPEVDEDNSDNEPVDLVSDEALEELVENLEEARSRQVSARETLALLGDDGEGHAQAIEEAIASVGSAEEYARLASRDEPGADDADSGEVLAMKIVSRIPLVKTKMRNQSP